MLPSSISNRKYTARIEKIKISLYKINVFLIGGGINLDICWRKYRLNLCCCFLYRASIRRRCPGHHFPDLPPEPAAFSRELPAAEIISDEFADDVAVWCSSSIFTPSSSPDVELAEEAAVSVAIIDRHSMRIITPVAILPRYFDMNFDKKEFMITPPYSFIFFITTWRVSGSESCRTPLVRMYVSRHVAALCKRVMFSHKSKWSLK